MGKIFNFSFLILYAVFAQKMVAAFDENTELSSVPLRREKRMNNHSGSSSSAPPNLPLWFEDFKKVNLENPTLVQITSPQNATNPGYAIHPYFIIARRVYTTLGILVFVHMGESGILQRQPIRACLGDPSGELVLIQVTNPIMLNNPVNRPFSVEHYPTRATDWAKAKVEVWIHFHRPHFHPQPQQSLTEIRLYDPTKVAMTHNGERIGHGYAINPFIVVANRDFIRHPFGVSSYPETPGQLKPHRIQNFLIHAVIVLVRLRDPVLLTVPVPGAFATENYLIADVAWAEATALEWIRDILNV